MRMLTQEMQQSLTPNQAIHLLKQGNTRFTNNLKANPNLLQQVNETSAGQYPFATILSCIDSRTPAETIFDQGLGDLLSIRIAGNILNEDILGSMEFGCKIAGSKLIAVIGHTKCGAIRGACEEAKLGYLTSLLHKITPAIDQEKNTGNTTINQTFIDNVATLNVELVIKSILEKSTILHAMIAAKAIALIGGIYNIETGVVNFFE